MALQCAAPESLHTVVSPVRVFWLFSRVFWLFPWLFHLILTLR